MSEEAERLENAYLYYAGISTFFKCPVATDPADAEIALVGVPINFGQPVERGAYLAPRVLRDASGRYGSRYSRHRGLNPFEICTVRDLGDVPLANLLDPVGSVREVTEFYEQIERSGAIPVSVGGDHSVLHPILAGLAGTASRHEGPIGIIQIDAHCDSVGDAFGIELHCGSMLRTAAEAGQVDPKRSIVIGLNGPLGTLDQDAYLYESGYTVLTVDEVLELGIPAVIQKAHEVVGEGPTYLSFDMDVMDLCAAPGVGSAEPGGLTYREAVALVRGLRGIDLVGADVVEFIPARDPAGTTALHAAMILYEEVLLIAEQLAGRK